MPPPSPVNSHFFLDSTSTTGSRLYLTCATSFLLRELSTIQMHVFTPAVMCLIESVQVGQALHAALQSNTTLQPFSSSVSRLRGQSQFLLTLYPSHHWIAQVLDGLIPFQHGGDASSCICKVRQPRLGQTPSSYLFTPLSSQYLPLHQRSVATRRRHLSSPQELQTNLGDPSLSISSW